MLISRLRPVELDMTVVYEVVISFVDPVAALAVMGRANYDNISFAILQ